eukprot:TRINITY_DN2437_c0_g1_i3.p1 TRINITY_DN2437_c0_g1~~TRINITY_DN2437_c0_g1_i3.p1  ORF type:complete len:422 (-),score=52.45 TRINITY_DN2437_c0_g1_i3:73-1338(-)
MSISREKIPAFLSHLIEDTFTILKMHSDQSESFSRSLQEILFKNFDGLPKENPNFKDFNEIEGAEVRKFYKKGFKQAFFHKKVTSEEKEGDLDDSNLDFMSLRKMIQGFILKTLLELKAEGSQVFQGCISKSHTTILGLGRKNGFTLLDRFGRSSPSTISGKQEEEVLQKPIPEQEQPVNEVSHSEASKDKPSTKELADAEEEKKEDLEPMTRKSRGNDSNTPMSQQEHGNGPGSQTEFSSDFYCIDNVDKFREFVENKGQINYPIKQLKISIGSEDWIKEMIENEGQFSANTPTLEDFTVISNELSIDGKFLSRVSQFIKSNQQLKLVALALRKSWITDKDILNLVHALKGCKDLKKLTLSLNDSKLVTDEGLKTIVVSFKERDQSFELGIRTSIDTNGIKENFQAIGYTLKINGQKAIK